MPCLEEPKLVVEVRFAEWTPDRLVRHPSFLRLRDDKKAREVVLDPRAGTTLPRSLGAQAAQPRPPRGRNKAW